MKHPVHIRHVGHVPLVERLVEGSCVKKHIPHIRHVGHVPIIERLVVKELLQKTNNYFKLSHRFLLRLCSLEMFAVVHWQPLTLLQSP